jgi:hypothetical protein
MKICRAHQNSLAEKPILINKVITSGSHKIGYLMYNGFTLNMMLY